MNAPRALLISLVSLLIPAVSAITPAQGQTQLCDEASALDPVAEVEASPRDNESAEMLALWFSRGAAADTGTYDTITADLARIALEHPEIAELPVYFMTDRSGLFVSFVDEATRDVAEAGGNPDFNCLNVIFDQDTAYWYNILPRVVFLGFDGNYRIEELLELYSRVPGVEFTELNGSTLLGDAGCFYQSDNGKRTYFFEEWAFFPPSSGPVRLARIEVIGGALSLVDEPYPYDPELAQEYLDCQAGLLGGPQVVGVPTASAVALGILAMLLAMAGLWISRRSTPA